MNTAPLHEFDDSNDIAPKSPGTSEPQKDGGTKEPSPDFVAFLNSRMAHPANVVPEDVPVFSLAGTPICHTGNITLIEANMKTGKTAFVAAMLSSIYSQPGADTLGWKSANPAGHAVIVFDTEQSRADHHNVIKRTHERTGADIFPAWLLPCRIKGMSIVAMKHAVEILLQLGRKEHGGVHSLILDGIGDLVPDANDAAASADVVAWLEKLAEEYDMPVITILHLNPVTQPNQGTKARGHLGTHLYRKAEHVLRLVKDKDEITTVSTVFARKAPLPKDSQPCFKYCVEQGRHVSTEKPNTSAVTKDIALRDLAAEVFSESCGVPLRYSDIKAKVALIRVIQPKSAEPFVKAMIDKVIIRKAGNGEGYVLS